MLSSPPERRSLHRSYSLSASDLYLWPCSEYEGPSLEKGRPHSTVGTASCPAHLRKTSPSCLQEFRQSSLSALDPPKGRGPLHQGQRHNKRRLHPLCCSNGSHSLSPQLPSDYFLQQTRPSSAPTVRHDSAHLTSSAVLYSGCAKLVNQRLEVQIPSKAQQLPEKKFRYLSLTCFRKSHPVQM